MGVSHSSVSWNPDFTVPKGDFGNEGKGLTEFIKSFFEFGKGLTEFGLNIINYKSKRVIYFYNEKR
ncbi:MAG: hypothetical protein ISS16_02915 [Ignavibacteria bacterium]|nr:hypothetical protein [Ignavibacteria bacterium]